MVYNILKTLVSLPDFVNYHRAALLARIIEWSCIPNTTLSVQLENALSSVDLHALLYSSPPASRHPLTPNNRWHTTTQTTQLFTSPILLTPLFHNSAFPPSLSTDILGGYRKADLLRIKDVLIRKTGQFFQGRAAPVRIEYWLLEHQLSRV